MMFSRSCQLIAILFDRRRSWLTMRCDSAIRFPSEMPMEEAGFHRSVHRRIRFVALLEVAPNTIRK